MKAQLVFLLLFFQIGILTAQDIEWLNAQTNNVKYSVNGFFFTPSAALEYNANGIKLVNTNEKYPMMNIPWTQIKDIEKKKIMNDIEIYPMESKDYNTKTIRIEFRDIKLKEEFYNKLLDIVRKSGNVLPEKKPTLESTFEEILENNSYRDKKIVETTIEVAVKFGSFYWKNSRKSDESSITRYSTYQIKLSNIVKAEIIKDKKQSFLVFSSSNGGTTKLPVKAEQSEKALALFTEIQSKNRD